MIIFYSHCLKIVVWKFLQRSKGSEVLATKQDLLHVVLFQYIPRFARFFPLNAELKKTAGVFAESALVGAAYYLLWYMLSSHVSISVMLDKISVLHVR
jgi:cyclic nucleotide gated channel